MNNVVRHRRKSIQENCKYMQLVTPLYVRDTDRSSEEKLKGKHVLKILKGPVDYLINLESMYCA